MERQLADYEAIIGSVATMKLKQLARDLRGALQALRDPQPNIYH